MLGQCKGSFVRSQFVLETFAPPEITSGPFWVPGIPLPGYEGAGIGGGPTRCFMSKPDFTSDGGGLGGRCDGVPHFAMESRLELGTRAVLGADG